MPEQELETKPEDQLSPSEEHSEDAPLSDGPGEGEDPSLSPTDEPQGGDGGGADEPEPDTIESLRERLEEAESRADRYEKTSHKREAAFDNLMSDHRATVATLKDEITREKQAIKKIETKGETFTDDDGATWFKSKPEAEQEHRERSGRVAELEEKLSRVEGNLNAVVGSYNSERRQQAWDDLESFRVKAGMSKSEFEDAVNELRDSSGQLFPNLTPAKAAETIKRILKGDYAEKNGGKLAREIQKRAEEKESGKRKRRVPGPGSSPRPGALPEKSDKQSLVHGILEVGLGNMN